MFAWLWKPLMKPKCRCRLASLMKDHYVSGVAKGWGEYDWAALGKINSDASGLE